MNNNFLNITHISDTHGYHENLNLRGGDVLIHSGDILDFEKNISIENTIEWLEKTPYQFKILVLGNHDSELLNYNFSDKIILLKNNSVVIQNINFYGLTGTLTQFNTKYTFGEKSENEIANELHGVECDILITHGPPKNILDNKLGRSVGSNSLLEYVNKMKPKYHLFGHAHHSKGQQTIDNTVFSNSSIVQNLFDKTLDGAPFDFTI